MDATARATDRKRASALTVRRLLGATVSLFPLHAHALRSMPLVAIGLFAVAGLFFEVPSAAQELLVLGQSPVGPLLEEEPGSWLDQVPAEPERIPESVVEGRFGISAESAPGQGFYEDVAPNGGVMYGEAIQCPDCGNSLSVACPTCSPVGQGALLGALHGARAPTDRWDELLQPMTQESWLFRPLSAGWFMGFMQGNELVEDWVGQGQGFFGGYRFGWDYDPYWGCEMRFGFASVALYDSDRAKAAQVADDLSRGITPDDPYFYRFDTRRDSGIRLWDVEMLWYPFGDTQLRPYFLLGMGSARVDFMDRLSERRIKSVLAMPIAIGFKYRLRDWLAVRVEATDNFIAGSGSGFKNLHNFSLTAGLEVRFGGTRTAYWPYYPGRHYW